jgi:hypothetical protein
MDMTSDTALKQSKIVHWNSAIWLITMACTLLTFFLAEASGEVKGRAMAVTGLAAAKFFMVAMVYMELRASHILWKALAVAYLVILAAIYALTLH